MGIVHQQLGLGTQQLPHADKGGVKERRFWGKSLDGGGRTQRHAFLLQAIPQRIYLGGLQGSDDGQGLRPLPGQHLGPGVELINVEKPIYGDLAQDQEPGNEQKHTHEEGVGP